jgi:hypothetical protein
MNINMITFILHFKAFYTFEHFEERVLIVIREESRVHSLINDKFEFL